MMTTTSVGGKIGTMVSSVKNELTRSLGTYGTALNLRRDLLPRDITETPQESL